LHCTPRSGQGSPGEERRAYREGERESESESERERERESESESERERESERGALSRLASPSLPASPRRAAPGAGGRGGPRTAPGEPRAPAPAVYRAQVEHVKEFIISSVPIPILYRNTYRNIQVQVYTQGPRTAPGAPRAPAPAVYRAQVEHVKEFIISSVHIPILYRNTYRNI
jgi:hypothetical protein